MIDDDFPNSLQGVREFAAAATRIGQFVAHFGLAAAYFTPIYREPDVESIDAIDAVLGSNLDVEGPLLTAHRLVKFYVISSGDALLSCCELVRKDHPMHIGSAALARTAQSTHRKRCSSPILKSVGNRGFSEHTSCLNRVFKSTSPRPTTGRQD